MLVGTGTVAVDDPQLTVRDRADRPLERQPLRAVMGLRDLPPDRRAFDDAAESVHLRTRDPKEALAELFARDRQHVFLEGGPTLAAAFWAAGYVDEVVAYVAPMLLGSGRAAVADLGIGTIGAAAHLWVTDVTVLEPAGPGDDVNVRLTMTPRPPPDVLEPGEHEHLSAVVERGERQRPSAVVEPGERQHLSSVVELGERQRARVETPHDDRRP
jgi:diaminohydroxyphosphoribosylaminopyrimidine deaminase/5-amino-6-(5-phosphoribosylamino)uracil reductase